MSFGGASLLAMVAGQWSSPHATIRRQASSYRGEERSCLLEEPACWRWWRVNGHHLMPRFAGRPAPTGEKNGLVFWRSQPAGDGGRSMVNTLCHDSPAGLLLQGRKTVLSFRGASLLAMVAGQWSTPHATIRRQASSYRGEERSCLLEEPTCWRWWPVNGHHLMPRFAGRPAPTEEKNGLVFVGASLLAMVAGQWSSPHATIRRQACSFRGQERSCLCRSQPAGDACRAGMKKAALAAFFKVLCAQVPCDVPSKGKLSLLRSRLVSTSTNGPSLTTTAAGRSRGTCTGLASAAMAAWMSAILAASEFTHCRPEMLATSAKACTGSS